MYGKVSLVLEARYLTWQELILWLACFYSGAYKGNPHVLGRYIVLVRATEDVDVRAAIHLQGKGAAFNTRPVLCRVGAISMLYRGERGGGGGGGRGRGGLG